MFLCHRLKYLRLQLLHVLLFVFLICIKIQAAKDSLGLYEFCGLIAQLDLIIILRSVKFVEEVKYIYFTENDRNLLVMELNFLQNGVPFDKCCVHLSDMKCALTVNWFEHTCDEFRTF